MPAIEVTGLEREFEGGIRAVDGVDLEVADGEIYAFLGPNGAGKTTTVRMLTTLLRPTGGSARIVGHDVVAEAAAVRRAIGVALQEAALDPLMTGRELIALQATLHGLIGDEAERRGAALLTRVGLSEAADRRVGTYSGGMRRRLDLASALVHEPRVLFLDEPTTGLDPVSPQGDLGGGRGAQPRGNDGLPHHPVPRGGRPARRPGRDHRQGQDRRRGHPRLAQGRGRQAPPRDRPLRWLRRAGRAGLRRVRAPLPERDGKVLVELDGGATEVAKVVRALDEAGIAVESLDLVEPTPRRRLRRQDRRAPRRRRVEHPQPESRPSRGLTRLALNLRVIAALGRRSVRQTFRRPQLIAPILVFPTLLLAIQTGGAGRAIGLEGFPEVNGFLDFMLAGAMVQSCLLAGNSGGIALAVDLEMGFTDRLFAAPISRFAIVAGPARRHRGARRRDGALVPRDRARLRRRRSRAGSPARC